MKIRIKENSVRLRLSKSEVESFLQTKEHRQSTNFGNVAFHYALKADDNYNHMHASFENNLICIFLPTSYLDKWKADNHVGFSEILNLGETSLALKVEKDFVCLDDTDEDQSDNYPNPNANQ